MAYPSKLISSTHKDGGIFVFQNGRSERVLEGSFTGIARGENNFYAILDQKELLTLSLQLEIIDRRKIPGGLHHDLIWDKGKLWVVDTENSSILNLLGEEVVVPFPGALGKKDACHLNCIQIDGDRRYATAFAFKILFYYFLDPFLRCPCREVPKHILQAFTVIRNH